MRVDEAVKRYLKRLDYQFYQLQALTKRRGFSNFAEENILEELIARLFPKGCNRTAVDIGASDGKRGSNTLFLFKNGWRGVGIESDSRKLCKLARTYKYFPDVAACRLGVTPANVVPLLKAYSIEREFEVLSLDIDSYDYFVLEAILSSYRPSIVISEINEKIPPPIRFRVKYSPDFQFGHHFYGYSISCLTELCKQFDYAIVGLEYNNVFLVPNELAGGHSLAVEEAYKQGYLNRPDRQEKFSRNEDMEILHSLDEKEGMEFIEKFFSHRKGEYELSLDGATMAETLQIRNHVAERQPSEPVELTRR